MNSNNNANSFKHLAYADEDFEISFVGMFVPPQDT